MISIIDKTCTHCHLSALFMKFIIPLLVLGVDPNLVSKILDPHFLSKISETFGNLAQTIQQNGPWASAWVGESGGAYNSGGRHVSNTFVNSFW